MCVFFLYQTQIEKISTHFSSLCNQRRYTRLHARQRESEKSLFLEAQQEARVGGWGLCLPIGNGFRQIKKKIICSVQPDNAVCFT